MHFKNCGWRVLQHTNGAHLTPPRSARKLVWATRPAYNPSNNDSVIIISQSLSLIFFLVSEWTMRNSPIHNEINRSRKNPEWVKWERESERNESKSTSNEPEKTNYDGLSAVVDVTKLFLGKIDYAFRLLWHAHQHPRTSSVTFSNRKFVTFVTTSIYPF